MQGPPSSPSWDLENPTSEASKVPEVWKAKERVIRGLIGEIKILSEKIYGTQMPDIWVNIQTKFTARVAHLINHDKKQYLSFHLLLESTPIYKDSPFLDFEGELSVEVYLREVLEKLKETDVGEQASDQ